MKKIKFLLLGILFAQLNYGQTVNWAYAMPSGFAIRPQSPAIAADGTVYIGAANYSSLATNYTFRAINPDGTLKWTYAEMGGYTNSSAAIGRDGTIYIGSTDNRLHAINPDGTSKWKSIDTGDDIVYSTPAIANNGTIYIGSFSDKLYAFNPEDGSKKWEFVTTGFNITASPAIASNGTVYIASDDDKLYALNPADGSILWSYNIGGDVEGHIALDMDGTIFVGVDEGTATGSVIAINPAGTLKWKSINTGRVLSSPALNDGFVYFGTKDTNRLYALNAATGVVAWSYTVGNIINSSPAIGDDGKIYFGSFDDKLYCLNPNGTLNFGINLSSPTTTFDLWSSPAIRNGKLYIGSYDGKLYSVNIPSTNPAGSNWPMFAKNLSHNSSADITSTYYYYTDTDADGYGAGTAVISFSPTAPTGFAAVAGDCNNANSSINPGALEIFDGIDNNCDGDIDDGFASNRINWAFNLGSRIEPQTSVIATDGTIYIGSEDNTNFHAINPDGTLKWMYTGLTDNVYSSASIAKDGTIYVGAKDNFLHAINPNGTQKWKFDIGGDAIYSTPSIAKDGTVYIGSDADKLFAVNPDGTQKWAFSTAGFNIRSTAAIAPNGTVYIASDDDKLYALNPVDGSTVWSYTLGGDVEGGITIDTDGTIFVGVDETATTGSVLAVNPNGTLKWKSATTGRVLSSPALNNGFVYFGTKDTNKLFALDASTGTEAWSYTVGGIINGSPTVGDDGKIYFGSFDDKLYCLNSDGILDFSLKISSFDLWSSPVIKNGKLYIGSYDGKLYCINIPSTNAASSNWPMFGKNLAHTSSAQSLSDIPTTPLTFCKGATVASAVGTTSLKFYAALTGGTALPGTVALTTKTFYVTETVNAIESAPRVAVSIIVNALPTEVIGTMTSNTAGTTPGTFAATTLAVGSFVGTPTTVSYRVPAFVGGNSYFWTVPAGVRIVGQAEGVRTVTQTGANGNVLNVNYSGIAAGIGSVGTITVQAQNANGCNGTAKSVTITKALPLAPAAITMHDLSLPLPTSGIPTAVKSFAKYMGTNAVLRLTATPSLAATSYEWNLPAGVNQLSGGTNNVITVNFAGVTSANTDNFITTAGVSTNVLRIGVKAVNGVGVSTVSNAALVNPTTTSTARLLTLTAVAPAAPTLKMFDMAVSSTVAVTDISKYIGSSTPLTLVGTVAATTLASSFSWELAEGVNVVAGSVLTSNTIRVNFEDVEPGAALLYLGVKAVNGVGSSVKNNAPASSSTATLLKLSAGLPSAAGTVVGSLAICSNQASSVIYTITAAASKTNLYIITSPVGTTITGGVMNTRTINAVAGATFTVNYPNGFTSVRPTQRSISIQSVNGFGVSAPKLLTLTSKACTTSSRTAKVAPIAQDFKVIAYPNPSSGVFNLAIESSKASATTIQVYDIQGRMIENKQVNANAVEIGANYTSGIYNVILENAGQAKTIRLIKK